MQPDPNFDVTTPLVESEWCESPAVVRHLIDSYMSTRGAVLAKVSVIEFSTGDRLAMGHERDPAELWP
jgi:hypothetical protein